MSSPCLVVTVVGVLRSRTFSFSNVILRGEGGGSDSRTRFCGGALRSRTFSFSKVILRREGGGSDSQTIFCRGALRSCTLLLQM